MSDGAMSIIYTGCFLIFERASDAQVAPSFSMPQYYRVHCCARSGDKYVLCAIVVVVSSCGRVLKLCILTS
jgi:hypothetical protein